MLLTLSDVPLRTASFSLEDRWLIWSEARLYADRLELSGWGLRGRYGRCIPFKTINGVDHEENHLILHLASASSLSLHMKAASRWHAAIVTHRAVYEG